jgi:tetratricopeptide (TPR) repeat protein
MGGWSRLLGALRPRDQAAAPVPVAAPAPAVDWKAQGNAALGEGDMPAAAESYRRATEKDPHDGAAWLNLGFCLLETGDLPAAGASLDQALRVAGPGAAWLDDVHYLRARVLAAQGQWGAAEQAFAAALAVRGSFPEASLGLGEALLHLERPRDALAALDAVLAQQPEHAGAWEGRGTALLGTEQPQAALEAFQRALALSGPNPDLLANIAAALHALDRLDEAVAQAREALRIDPSHGRAKSAVALGLANMEWNEGVANLLAGDMTPGWVGYECRLAAPGGYYELRPLPAGVQVWRGEDLAGRTILLEAEQGLGDTLMMLRYLPLVAQRAARVWVRVQPVLEQLARQVAPGCEFCSSDAPLPVLPDFVCPLMSLPRAFGTTLDTIPSGVPYLHADPVRAANWRRELDALPGRLKVGIAWAGNPTHKNDARRSMPLAALHALAGEDCTFLTVQPKIPESALADWPQLHRFGDRLRDFSDTADLFEALDLVITVDTSVAHLAGALGRPVWVLLPHQPEWRWLMTRVDSPWYPSAKIYRQPGPGDWKSVVEAVRLDLPR